MLYNLIQIRRGKSKVVMTDSLTKVRSRMKTLRQSQRTGIKGERVKYETKPADESTEKFKEKPDTKWRRGQCPPKS